MEVHEKSAWKESIGKPKPIRGSIYTIRRSFYLTSLTKKEKKVRIEF